MDRGFDVPAPGRGGKRDRHLRREVSHVGGRDHRLRRRGWMQIERDLECFGTLQDRPEDLVVQVATPDMAVDQCTLEAVFTDHVLQFVGGGIWSHGRQRGEPGETAWMTPYCHRELVVGIMRECHCLGRVELLHARRGQRQDLHVDPGSIHLRDPVFIEFAQSIQKLGKARRHLGMVVDRLCLVLELASWTFHECCGRVMLFKCDRSHCLMISELRHSSLPRFYQFLSPSSLMIPATRKAMICSRTYASAVVEEKSLTAN